jgi:hypothetical protein
VSGFGGGFGLLFDFKVKFKWVYFQWVYDTATRRGEG